MLSNYSRKVQGPANLEQLANHVPVIENKLEKATFSALKPDLPIKYFDRTINFI